MSVSHPAFDRNIKSKPTDIPTSELILVSEDRSAVLLGVSKPTFRDWVTAGIITPVPLPGNIRRKLYRRTDLEAFANRLPSAGNG